MIHSIKGKITETGSGYVVIENSGIGFLVNVPLGDAAFMAADEDVTLYTAMQVKEDDISLFGFSEKAALEMFNLLITVSGVGGKAAMSVLSALNPAELQRAIMAGDVKAISSANGVGKKTAERIIIDLKDKVEKLGILSPGEIKKVSRQAPILGERAKAVNMLIATGASKNDAENAVASIEDDTLKASQYFMLAAKMFK